MNRLQAPPSTPPRLLRRHPSSERRGEVYFSPLLFKEGWREATGWLICDSLPTLMNPLPPFGDIRLYRTEEGTCGTLVEC